MAEKQPLKSNLFNMTVALVIVCTLSALILAYVHRKTEAPIKAVKDNLELRAIAKIVPEGFDNNPFAERTHIATSDNKRLTMYPVRRDGIIVALAIKSYTNRGFGGKMEIMVGFTLDGSIHHDELVFGEETPGLGTKVADEAFAGQFKGLNPDKIDFRVKKDGGDIDAVTAATISSRAVIDAIQRAYDAYTTFSAGI